MQVYYSVSHKKRGNNYFLKTFHGFRRDENLIYSENVLKMHLIDWSCGNLQKMMKNVISKKKKRDFLKIIFFFRNFYK
jgi:hypothetical protein